MTYDPYAVLSERPDLTVVWNVDMPQRGRWYQRLQTMLIKRHQSQAERRCTVAHELIHAERGDTTCDPSVHKEAARRLICMHDLAAAVMVHGEDWHRVADELWVDDDTLAVRLDSLHPSERGFLLRRLSMKEQTA